MKKHQLLVVVALMTTLLCSSAFGAQNNDRVFGNGRFLKRFRGDSKGPTRQPSPKKPANKSKKADPKANGKAPTPAKRLPSQTPTPAARTNRSTTAAIPPIIRSNSVIGQTNRRNGAGSVVVAKDATLHSNNNQAVGFGMRIETRNEQLVVVQVDRRGNAHQAGIKKGDVVVDAGGAEIDSIEALDEISKILGNGDQLEFEIERRGKKNKVLVQFGEAPDESPIVEQQSSKEKDYSLVPESDEASGGGMRSIWDKPQAMNRPHSPPIRTSQRPVVIRLNSPDAHRVASYRRQIAQMQQEVERLRARSGKTILQ